MKSYLYPFSCTHPKLAFCSWEMINICIWNGVQEWNVHRWYSYTHTHTHLYNKFFNFDFYQSILLLCNCCGVYFIFIFFFCHTFLVCNANKMFFHSVTPIVFYVYWGIPLQSFFFIVVQKIKCKCEKHFTDSISNLYEWCTCCIGYRIKIPPTPLWQWVNGNTC